MKRCARQGSATRVAVLLAAFAALPSPALANSDPMTGVAAPGGVGIGALVRAERSPYRNSGSRYDFLPTYLYEGERAYLHSHSVGLKFGRVRDESRFDLFIRRRFEGSPYETPEILTGMARREPGLDAGASLQAGGDWGIAFAEVLHDYFGASKGTELRVGYRYPWRSGRLWLRPHLMFNFRNAKLNDYYYGVRPDEATAARPAYEAAGGAGAEIGLYGAYVLTERWRLIGGYTLTRWPHTVAASPVFDRRTTAQVTFGVMYDLSPDQEAWPDKKPLIVRAYNGDSSDCNVAHIARLTCTTTHTKDRTGVAGFEIGRPFIDRLNGWPVDIAGFIGIQRHREEGFQPDFWSARAYVKTWYYGFPWESRVRTRIGLGIGLSYAQRIPLMEIRDQQGRGRNTSKLLNTFDPTVDVSVGDVIGVKRLRETYVGLGVSHRSGIFGTSQLLGNVYGGSNYIYTYVETTF